MRITKLTLLLATLLPCCFSFAQNVGIGTTNPHPSAQLEIQSTTKGTLITTMTTVQRIAIDSPATGLLVFDIDKRTIYMFDGNRWLALAFNSSNKNPPAYFPTSPVGPNEAFGYRVNISGVYAIVGAYQSATGTGKVYIFEKVNGVWQEQQQITASDGEAGDFFGASVAINSNFAAIGAWGDDINANANQGSVYIYSRVGSTWNFQNKITAADGLSNDFFGYSLDISSNNDLIVGAYGDDIGGNNNQGSAYLFEGSQGFGGYIWTLSAKLTASDGDTGDSFGAAVSIFPSGIAVIIGAYADDIGLNIDQGSVYTFFAFGGWVTGMPYHQKTVATDGEANDYYGVSVSTNGIFMVAGASGDDINANNDQGSAYKYQFANNFWVSTGKIAAGDGMPNDNFGISVSVGTNQIAVGAYRSESDGFTNAGVVYIYGALLSPTLIRKIVDDIPENNGFFGFSVGLSGYELIIGAYGKGSRGQVGFLNLQ